MEYQKDGRMGKKGKKEKMGYKKDGMMEWWNNGIMGTQMNDRNPIFQHSSIPISQWSSDSIIPSFHYSTIPIFQFLEE